MIVNRLRVRGKLNLLILLPLTAVVLVAVPFVAGQVQSARSAKTTADAARNARQLGALVWELQQERLVTAGYLADPTADDTAMVLQRQLVGDSADALRRSVGSAASDELTSALVRLGSLDELRQNARHRGAALDSVARAYHAVIKALVDALRLVPQRTSDAEGTRALTALDALLRANEESALRGMALVATAASPRIGRDLAANASAQSQMFIERFVQQADVDQAALVVLVDQGEAARRTDAVAQHPPDPRDPVAVKAFVGVALAAAESQAGLRRLVQDRVTSQIADAARARAATAGSVAWTVGAGTLLLFVLVIGLAVAVSRSIAIPLLRLTRAAGTVSDLAQAELVRVTDVERADEQPPRLAAVEVPSGDEVGELAVAFNQVQATAALLLERQVVSRRNVSQMFANVAQRTQNLVRRQLALVDELERDEQNTRLLSRLYRLDHVSTRLRRNAENLLVIAGSRSESRIAAPAPLTTVLRSALAEIEDYQRVDLRTAHAGTVAAALVSDLVLVFAELFENATAFSPPESQVTVGAVQTVDGGCEVSVVDHGIGMTVRQLAVENRRLVERERLDIAPTSVLGLFVVGRLARRHGLTVELVSTLGQGTTATVVIPPSLYLPDAVAAPVPVPARPRVARLRRPAPAVPSIPAVPGRFLWFTTKTAELPAVRPDPEPEPRPDPQPEPRPERERTGPEKQPEPAQEPPPGPEPPATGTEPPAAGTEPPAAGTEPPAAGPERHAAGPERPAVGGARSRRVPGAHLPTTAREQRRPAPAEHDATAARTAMDALQTALARADAAPAAPPGATAVPQRLSRRTPGASLAPGLRNGSLSRQVSAAPHRDPEADRAAFDGYVAGLAEAGKATDSPPLPKESRQ